MSHGFQPPRHSLTSQGHFDKMLSHSAGGTCFKMTHFALIAVLYNDPREQMAGATFLYFVAKKLSQHDPSVFTHFLFLDRKVL